MKKRIPTVIDKCSDCPFCHLWNIKGRLKCEHVVSEGVSVIHAESEEIPDWCPLPNAIDFSILELDRLKRQKEKAERSLKFVQGIDAAMRGKLPLMDGDIITRYMRQGGN